MQQTDLENQPPGPPSNPTTWTAGNPVEALRLVAAGLVGRTRLGQEEIEALQRELNALADHRGVRFTSSEQLKAEAIIGFFLRPTVESCLELWFGKSEQTDADIWARFGDDVARATAGEYDHWALNPEHPRMLLALILLLDQFRRNMYRNSPEMYATDARCLAMVKRAMRHGMTEKLRLIERVFPCLVLTHSEALEDQQLCMHEWSQVEAELAPTDPLRVFREVFQRHVTVIERFGRFPHRNELLGRMSTAEEAEFLADADFRFDLPLVQRPDGSFCFLGPAEGRPLPSAGGQVVPLAYHGPDGDMARAEQEIRTQGFAQVGDVRLHKFIVERPAPPYGSRGYRALMGDLKRSREALQALWPRMRWVETFYCADRMYCVYMADSAETLRRHSVLADLPMDHAHRVHRVVDQGVFA